MTMDAGSGTRDAALGVLCTRGEDAWQIWRSRQVFLNFDDLGMLMAIKGLTFKRRGTGLGDVEVEATGDAADEVAAWLAAALVAR